MTPQRRRPRALTSLLLSFAVALACSKLEESSDFFPLTSNGGTTGAGGTGGAAGSDRGGAAVGGAGGTAASGGKGGSSPGSSVPSSAGEGGLGAAAGAAQGGESCVDDAGLDGHGCFACEATSQEELAEACTDATCTPFDNALRLPLLKSGEVPALPPLATGGTGGGGTGPGAPPATAGYSCRALARTGALVYVTGSSALKPFLQQIAQQLVSSQVYLIYTAVGSCAGVDAIVNGTPMKSGAAPLPATATYWDSSASTGKACDLPSEGVVADLGISDVFAPTCSGFELSNLAALSVRDALGPVQTMAFVVPSNSRQRVLSQQAAYSIFGLGAQGDVRDQNGQAVIFDDEEKLQRRNASSGTQAMIAAAIGVPATRWKGRENKSSEDVAVALQAAAATEEAANAALGILAADYIDSRNLRAQLRTLAYQDSHQTCGFFPDSTDTARDKRNVRDGHYPIWGPLHLLYKVNELGQPANEAVRERLSDIIGYLSGSKALPNGVQLIDLYAQSGVIPQCAMRVSRTSDGGSIKPTRPDSPCSCLFELKATGRTSCKACKVQGDCPASQSCSQGYCED